ncbi:MAG: hypothetical protein WCP28_07495 [Actinomycetes bacterium]
MTDQPDDPNLKWDMASRKWLRWNGTEWTDATTGVATGQSAAPQVPVYGPGYIPPRTPKQKHTARNVILIILLVFVLLIGGCSVLLFAGTKGAVDSANKAQASSSAAATASCAGKTYLDAQPGNDNCADAANTVNYEGMSITATPLAPVKEKYSGLALCSTITLKNTSNKSQDYNVFDYKIQTPSGDVATTSAMGTGQSLNSGVLVSGGTKTGQICSTYSGAKGQYVLIYDPSPFTDFRGIWLTKVK